VKNPSLTIERGDEGPLHNVEVQYLTMNITRPDGGTEWWRWYPNGDLEYYDYPGQRFYFEGNELRWDATVHPGETSLVFYSGWLFTVDVPSIPGIHQHTYARAEADNV
jgi:hypothetical protein